MHEKPDWFKMFPSLFLQDTTVDAMTTEELGATMRLLCRQWMDGHIPNDKTLVGRLCRLNSSAIDQAWPILCQFFPEIEPGKRANRYMWIERETVVAAMAKKRNDGRDAVTKRWDAIRALKGTNRTPIPNLIQEKEKEKETEQETYTELCAEAPKAKAPRKPREKKPTTGPSIAEILKTDGTPDGDKLESRYWKTAAYWDSTKNPKPREAAIEYRKLYDAKTDLIEVVKGAIAYRASFMPPARQSDETKYMIGFLEWIKQEGWQNYIEREAM